MSEEKKQAESRQKLADNKRKDKKDSLQKKYIELDHKYKRALADYQNLLKRTAQEKQEFVKFANEQLLFEILPVYDNLKMSLVHIDEEVKKNGWAEGIKYVVKQFRGILYNMGIEEIKTVGEKFDPKLMEAVKGKGNRVKKEIRPGYKLNGKVIVPAKVILE